MPQAATRLQDLAGLVRPLAFAGERTVPLLPALEDLFPAGLKRGSTVVVTTEPTDRSQGSTSLALSLAAGASTTGAWCAVVGFPDLGVAAAAELGLALDRLALVPQVAPAQWLTVVGALLDAIDVVVVRPPMHLRQGDARRLTTRARERGAVLVPVLTGAWADGAETRLVVTGSRWTGTGAGEGSLTGRRLEVSATGRGAAARPRPIDVWLPANDGGERGPYARGLVS